MAFSPQTPIRSRQTSPAATSSPLDSLSNRRASRSSIGSHSQGNCDPNLLHSGGRVEAGAAGLGNLADELADAFSDPESEPGSRSESEAKSKFVSEIEDGRLQDNTARGSSLEAECRHGRDIPLNTAANGSADVVGRSASPIKHGHRRTGSDHDGNEFGPESDLDSLGLPSSLVVAIDAIETMALRGAGTVDGPADGVFERVSCALRDLSSQTGVEGNTTRLITAHTALSTHITHQTRQLHSLTFPLLSPFVQPPDAETVDEVLPLLLALTDTMPRPNLTAYKSLAALHSLTSDLVETLNYLSDSLHMSRQTTTAATRRLKSAKELVAEIRREDTLREEGELFLAQGNWGERLKNRECAGVCGEVVGGFEEVCNDWRAKLLSQVQSTPA